MFEDILGREIDYLNTNVNGILSIILRLKDFFQVAKHAQIVDMFRKCL